MNHDETNTTRAWRWSSTILVMLVMSALLAGFTAIIVADQRASGRNRDQTQAYAAAHAGLEKLTADLGALFVGGNFTPSAAQIAALTTDAARRPRVRVRRARRRHAGIHDHRGRGA